MICTRPVLILACLLAAVLSPARLRAAELPLEPGPHRDLTIQKTEGNVWEIVLGEGHPHFWTDIVPKTYDPAQHSVVALEYFAPSGLDSVVLRYRASDESMAVAEVTQVPLAETWQPLAFDLSRVELKPAAGHPEMRFHFALNGAPKSVVQFRHVRLRGPTPEELERTANQDKVNARRETEAAAILADLRATYAGKISAVQVQTNAIIIKGSVPGPCRLVGIPPESTSFQADSKTSTLDVRPNPQGEFEISVSRIGKDQRDRAVWRWRLADEKGQWLTAASWSTAYDKSVQRKLPHLTAPHQKGIGVPPIQNADHELFTLGLRHATMNVVIHALFRESPAEGWTPWEFEGRTYYLNEGQLKQHDTTLRLLAKNDILVSAILLVGNHRHANGKPHTILTHPEAEVRGIYSIPNLTEEEAARFYCAALHHMAERWSREDGSHGRVINWIMHNEIDQGATWTNMGAQPLPRYLETYHRSARLMHHTARLFDPQARVFISLTHHWAKKSSGSGTYVVRDMLDLFAEMGRAEGDYEWGVAYHPYPRDLRNPDAWKDEGLTNDFDTPWITPKNIAVLPAYLDQARFHYQGKPRGILLSEQGFNTPTLSQEDQRRQVAGLIYMFRQIRPLKSIEAFHLHRYHDMPVQEGGLRLGIITETGAHKLGWDAYQAIGTEKETEFAKMADEVMQLPAAAPLRQK